MPAWPSLAFCGGLGVAGCGLGAIGLGGPPIRPVSRYVQAVLSDQPVSYWRLADLNAALVADECGRNSGTGSATGITYRVSGPLAEGAYGMTFDGAAGNLTIPYAASLAPGTVSLEVWVKFAANPGATAGILADENSLFTKGLKLVITSAGLANVQSDAGTNISSPSALTLGSWHHIVGTYDGASLRLYVDGVLVAGPTASAFTANDGGALRIASIFGGSNLFAGQIGEAALYAYSLTAKQIANHYRLGRRVFLFPDMPELAAPYIAHLYTNGMQFKKTLGSADGVRSLRGKPGLKMTINGGYHPIELDTVAPQPNPNLVVDPGFEASNTIGDVQTSWTLDNVSEWSLVTGSTDLVRGRRGFKNTTTRTGASVWASATSKTFPIVPGGTYRISGWQKRSAGCQSSGWVQLLFFDSTGALMSAAVLSAAPTGGNGALPWTFCSTSGVAPANAVTACARLLGGWWDGVTGTDAQTWFDEIRIVLGTHVDDPVVLGDIIQLTEQGDPSATVLYTGIVERIAGVTLSLTPLVAELGRTDFNKSYLVLTDVAQMVRDAINATNHLRVQPETCGDTGVLALYVFNTTSALEVMQQAKRIAGPGFFTFIDATGLGWFQPVPTTTPPRLTLKRSRDYNVDPLTQPVRSIDTLINLIRALGGFAPGSTTNPPQSTYSNAASQLKYGKHALTPLVFPTVYDQATLDKIVATIANALDRERTSTEIDLPNYGQRLTFGVAGGLSARLADLANDPYPQPMVGGSGAYLGPYVGQDIEVDGVQQKLVLADVAVASLDELQPILDRMVQAAGVLPASF